MHSTVPRLLFLVSALLIAGCSASGPETTEAEDMLARGEAYFVTCSGCHGNDGEGLSGMQAPRLAGLPAAYIERQLMLYRKDVRGGPEDYLGVQMNGRAKALPNEQALEDVAAYIATLPQPPAPETRNVSQARGEEHYATCIACHGAQGQGMAEQGAPPLAGTDPAYLARQLRNFREGIRGREGDDAGEQMRAAALILPDEEAVETVAQYASSLR